MTLFLSSSVQQDVVDAQAQICTNCGFPNGRGTDKWADIYKVQGENIWCFLKPPVEGWMDDVDTFTQTQMLNNVTDVTDLDTEYANLDPV